MSDYYEVLGVARDASPEEIKKAYRRLARKLHPDVAGPGSEDAFKEVSVAYQTLSDPDKRRRYDMGGDANPFGGDPMGGFGSFSDIFETVFGQGMRGNAGPVPRGRRGQDTLTNLTVTLADVVFGATKRLNISTAVRCGLCGGSCCQPGTSPRTCDVCGGRGSVQRVAHSLLGQVMTSAPCTACHGHGTIIPNPCSECGGEGRVRTTTAKDVRVPAGVDEGTRLRMSGEGEVGPGGGPAGDLYVELHIRPDPVFRRRGNDLVTTVRVPMTTAVLGTSYELETLDGPQTVNIPAGTQPGTVITLDNLGVGILHRRDRGDLQVQVDVVIPRDLDAQQLELMEQLAGLRGEERIEPAQVDDGGVFSRLRDRFAGRG